MKRSGETQTVDDLRERGARRKYTDKEDKQVVDMFSTNPRLSLRQTQAKLKKEGTDLSCECILWKGWDLSEVSQEYLNHRNRRVYDNLRVIDVFKSLNCTHFKIQCDSLLHRLR